ncbi:Membrane transport PIN-like protein [Abortiporus biennis]
MPSAGFLIFSSCMPLIKTYMCIFCGYILARYGIFPPAAAKGASQIFISISLPGLIFSNIVPAFTPQNISALGPLFLLAFTYILLGFLFGIIIREICYVPRNFWQGIVVMSGMSNWANLPNAVVLSVTQQAPFNPTTDPTLGVSFVSIFIVTYHIVFWVCGVAHSLSWDYLPGVPQGIDAEKRVSWHAKPLASMFRKYVAKSTSVNINKKEQQLEAGVVETRSLKSLNQNIPTSSLDIGDYGITEVSRVQTQNMVSPSPDGSVLQSRDQQRRSLLPDVLRPILQPLSVIITPITASLFISLPVALVPTLKALFVDTNGVHTSIGRGPDGRPPLAFVIDTAGLLGDMAIPLALIVLGSSFSRLRIPRPISRLPWIAMLSVSFSKMVLTPIIGIFIVQAMVKRGMINETKKEANIEKFVAMFLSGSPAAVNQLIVASLYAPNGDVDIHSAFFLVQYALMFFTSSALTAVSLLLL